MQLAGRQAVTYRRIVVVPIANHDNNQHAPNEDLRVANLWQGIEIYAALMAGL